MRWMRLWISFTANNRKSRQNSTYTFYHKRIESILKAEELFWNWMTSCLLEQVPEKQEGSRWWADGNESSFLLKKIEENEDIKAKCCKTLNN